MQSGISTNIVAVGVEEGSDGTRLKSCAAPGVEVLTTKGIVGTAVVSYSIVLPEIVSLDY